MKITKALVKIIEEVGNNPERLNTQRMARNIKIGSSHAINRTNALIDEGLIKKIKHNNRESKLILTEKGNLVYKKFLELKSMGVTFE